MTLGAIIGTQLTDHAARAYRLTIGGLDMIKPYSPTWSTLYGVIIESISLTEEGPGGVSSLSFTIDDPRIEVRMAVGDEVEFWDITRTQSWAPAGSGMPLFRGFIQNFAIRPDGVNRYLDVTCVGVEVVLDWMVVPTYTIPDGTEQAAAIQSLVYNATGIGFPLWAASGNGTIGDSFGAQATPVAGYGLGISLQYDVVVSDGSSLRQAIADVFAACNVGIAGSGLMSGAFATVDFYGGLRTIEAFVSVNDLFVPPGVVGVYEPSDYSTGLTSVNTAAGQHWSTGLSFNMDQSGTVRGVYIRGATAAGSGLVSDGSGIPGPISYLSDDTSTTAAIRNAIAVDYLSRFSTSIRATFDLDPVEDSVLALGPRPGSNWYFGPDNEVFSATVGLPIYSIRKSFIGGTQTWSMAIGGFPPSVVKQIRRLTRDVRS